jgi:hypothetical protein
MVARPTVARVAATSANAIAPVPLDSITGDSRAGARLAGAAATTPLACHWEPLAGEGAQREESLRACHRAAAAPFDSQAGLVLWFDRLIAWALPSAPMAMLRRVLAPLTAVWLCCQLASVTLVPVAMWTTAPRAGCACAHGSGAMCPMHHKPAGRSAPCVMQAATIPGTALLTTFAGLVGIATERTSSPVEPPIAVAYPRTADVRVTGEVPVPPDPPPPRA